MKKGTRVLRAYQESQSERGSDNGRGKKARGAQKKGTKETSEDSPFNIYPSLSVFRRWRELSSESSEDELSEDEEEELEEEALRYRPRPLPPPWTTACGTSAPPPYNEGGVRRSFCPGAWREVKRELGLAFPVFEREDGRRALS